jgi:hypothetical protein
MLYKTTLARVNPKLYTIKTATPGQNTTFTNIAI